MMATCSSTESNEIKRRRHVLLGVTGSVAAVKCPELAVRLATDCNADVKVLLTKGGLNFWEKAKLYDSAAWETFLKYQEDAKGHKDDIIPKIEVINAEDEWEAWNVLGDPVLHIDLRDWADVLLIAPLSAHTLAKISQGLCDDTLSCVARAWDYGHGTDRPGKPLLLAPAMNTAMWYHPLTQRQLDTIQGFWNKNRCAKSRIVRIEPQKKTLACGEVGNGALASVEIITESVLSVFS